MSVSIVLKGNEIKREITDKDVICADGGYSILPKGVVPIAIIGDFDSLSEKPLGIKLVPFPSEKNFTDGELAVRYAVESGYKNINIYGALGGKQDHVLGNLSLLSVANKLNASAVIREENLDIYLAEGNFDLKTAIGDSISIIPVSEALIYNSENLYYPLKNLLLTSSDTRGISNIATDTAVSLSIEYGRVLVFHYFN